MVRVWYVLIPNIFLTTLKMWVSLLKKICMTWSNVKYHVYSTWLKICINKTNSSSKVKLGIKELLNKEQTGFKDYQLFYTINILLNREPLSIQEMPKVGISEHKIVKISKKGTLEIFWTNCGTLDLLAPDPFRIMLSKGGSL